MCQFVHTRNTGRMIEGKMAKKGVFEATEECKSSRKSRNGSKGSTIWTRCSNQSGHSLWLKKHRICYWFIHKIIEFAHISKRGYWIVFARLASRRKHLKNHKFNIRCFFFLNLWVISEVSPYILETSNSKRSLPLFRTFKNSRLCSLPLGHAKERERHKHTTNSLIRNKNSNRTVFN